MQLACDCLFPSMQRLLMQAPHLFVQYGIRPPRGVLLHGPPGCGKTMLAAAAAAEAGATLFVLNGSDIVTEAVGESEQGLRGAWAASRHAAGTMRLEPPCRLTTYWTEVMRMSREQLGQVWSRYQRDRGNNAMLDLLTCD